MLVLLLLFSDAGTRTLDLTGRYLGRQQQRLLASRASSKLSTPLTPAAALMVAATAATLLGLRCNVN
jgi:hypothetical protein